MNMFDTHAHLNFSRFKKNLDEVVALSKSVGVSQIVVPGTDVESSKRAVEIASHNEGIYAAVGIHPHHVYVITQNSNVKTQNHSSKLKTVEIENLLKNDKVVAVGEIGLDRHVYQDTKYKNYHIDESFMQLQKELFVAQLELAIKYNKSVIVHNREAKTDLLKILSRPAFASAMAGKMVFHCCEPDPELLQFARDHHIYIGIDGDITYRKDKQEFIKQVPLEMLVLETDSPFLLPEPLRSQKLFPNTPTNLPLIAKHIADLREESEELLKEQTTENAKKLFQLP